MKQFFKITLLVIVVFLTAGQFVRPSHVNPPIDPAKTLMATAQVPDNVQSILERSCNDCHSNKTVYPWYSNVAPISWWLASHINDGRRNLNFSEWGTYAQKRKLRKLKEICDQVKEDEMPIGSYLPMHPKAKLSGADKLAICTWTAAETSRVSATSP